jgi:hypothetical protein
VQPEMKTTSTFLMISANASLCRSSWQNQRHDRIQLAQSIDIGDYDRLPDGALERRDRSQFQDRWWNSNVLVPEGSLVNEQRSLQSPQNFIAPEIRRSNSCRILVYVVSAMPRVNADSKIARRSCAADLSKP